MKKPSLLILAAGLSSRMGKPKQLLPFKKNTLLGTVIDHCLEATISEVYCVLGAHAQKIESQHQSKRVIFIENESYHRGLSTSIVCGVKAIIKKVPDTSGILILLGDQPFITSSMIQEYLSSFSKNNTPTIATSYNGSIGVPAVFPKRQFKKLLDLREDSGAKQLLRTIEDKLLMNLSDNSLVDVDTLEDYEKALNLIS